MALTAALMMSLSCVAACAAVTVRDARGKLHRPLEAKGKRASALVFVAHDCPISNSYAPEINRLHTEYAKRGINFYVVYVDAKMTAAAAQHHAREFGFKSPVLLDTKHTLAKATGATVTPEAVVVLPGGKLLYRGRVDNKHVAYGKTRRAATKHDLRDVLELILAGKPPRQPIVTTAVGCFISGN
ncbi:MAG TPA: redoxin family protein [Abditibacteriaceae bacterium]